MKSDFFSMFFFEGLGLEGLGEVRVTIVLGCSMRGGNNPTFGTPTCCPDFCGSWSLLGKKGHGWLKSPNR